MRIGGFVMLGLAVLELVERFVLSFWLDLDTSLAGTAGFAVLLALLGVAMLQGSEAARKAALWITGLAIGVLLLAMGGLFVAGFGHLWPIFAAGAVTAVGIFALNVSREPRLPVVVGALSLVAVGWIGSVLSTIFLAGTLDLSTINLIRQWSDPRRAFEDEEAGLEMKAPPGWVLLKKGNPVIGEEKALVTLANTEVICFSQIFAEARTYSSADNLEYFLNGVVKSKEAETGFQELGRSDARIGPSPARRIKISWRPKKVPFLLYVTAWQDGDVFYRLDLFGPGLLAKRLDDELQRLEKAVSFTGPWASFLRDRAGPIRAGCPLLSEKTILILARAIPRDAAAEAFCREGYRLAFKGQPYLDSESGERLRTQMRAFFDVIPRTRLSRFGAYVEALRADQSTSPGEDREMMDVARMAVESLAPDAQDALRGSLGMAIEMGRFGHR